MSNQEMEPKPLAEKDSGKNLNSDDKKSSATAKESKVKPSVKKKPKNNHSFLSVIALCIGLCAVALAGYDFWILQSQVPANARVANIQQNLQSLIDQLGRQIQTAKVDIENEVKARESAQAEHQALSTAMDNVSAKLGRSTVAWRMAEVEYLLTVANHRLILAQDRETAITIFETADERIKAIGDTSLLKVRKAIADELLALRAMPEVDISGLTLKVSSLLGSVDQLPLLDKKRIAVAMNNTDTNTERDWHQIPTVIWNDLKSLVQVRRHQQPTEPLLPPDETRHLYQNLNLKLEQARLAALKRDTALFHLYINEAVSWLTNYFDAESPIVQTTATTLKEMMTINLQPAIPDVSGSLRLLREVMKGQREETAVRNTQVEKK